LTEPLVGPAERFADRLGINGIALMPLHIGRRYRLGIAAASGRMPARSAFELAARGHFTFRVDAVDSKNRLHNIEHHERKSSASFHHPVNAAEKK
jgi:hypothetical protein